MQTGALIRRLWLAALLFSTLSFSSPGAAQTLAAWGRNDYWQSSPPGVVDVVSISGGFYHSLGLASDGTVFAWGRDNYGQATVPASLSRVVGIAAGDYFNLALRGDGTVIGWGRNTSNPTNVPSSLSNVVAVAAGAYHSVALRGDGSVVAWGSNSDRQTDVPAAAVNKVVAIAAGGYHTLALKADGRVLAWGDNTYGQTNVPLGATNIVAIAAGRNHDLALRADGTVVAWGNNSSGQTNVPAGLSGVVAVAAGYSHSLALTADGTIWGWGSDAYGQIDCPFLSGVTVLAAGAYQSVALVGNGAPWFGPVVSTRQALAGTTAYLSVPLSGQAPLETRWQFNGADLPAAAGPVLTLADLQMSRAGVYRLAATNAWGGGTSAEMQLEVLPFWVLTNPAPRLALLRGDATFSVQVSGEGPFTYEWLFNGDPMPGQSGSQLVLTNLAWDQAGNYSVRITNKYGTRTSAEAALTITPVAAWGYSQRGQTNVPPGLQDIVAVANGSSHSLALMRDGSVAAWGTYDYSYTPVTPPADLSNVVGVAAGDSFSVALLADGTVRAWSEYASPGTNLPPGLSNVVSVAAGAGQALALRADGSLVAWGNATAVPEGIEPVVQIAAGGGTFIGLRAEGTVVVWGDNSSHQTNIPPGLSNVIAVTAGQYNSAALRSDGTVVAWGDNASGQTNVPAGLSNIVGIASGAVHMLSRDNVGTVSAWGSDYSGNRRIPPDLRGVTAIAAGPSVSTAVIGDGPPWFPPLPRYTVIEGLTVNLAIPASGALPMSYQWQLYGTNLPGATSAVLSLASIRNYQAGPYRLMARNAFGTATSSDVAVSTVPLRFHFQPHDVTVISGQPATLAVSLEGVGPFKCQWLHDGQPVPAATNDSLSIASTRWTDAGRYSVVVTNAYGRLTSSSAELRVIPVVAWGNADYLTTAPKDLTNAVALAAGGGQILAARRDGTVAAWDGSGGASWLTQGAVAVSNVVAVAATAYNCYGLQSNGTLVAWAHPWYGSSYLPADLSEVVSISAAGGHALALRSDGSVVPLGSDTYGECRVPPGLSDVVAVAAGGYHSLALRGDGRVIGWGLNDAGQSSPPADLTNVIAIAAGDNQSLAVRADGTMVTWGYNTQGQISVPSGLSNVIAAASGYGHSAALGSDGATRVWGASALTNPPAWLGNDFTAIACGSYFTALMEGNGPPFVPPVVRSRTGLQGLTSYLYVPVTGGRPFTCQWQFKGADLPGATNALLTLKNVTPAHAGNYRLVVRNQWGTASSTDIDLVVEPLRVTRPPQNTNTHLSGVLALDATVEGMQPMSYQWLFNGQPIAGQTNAGLRLSGLDWSQEGSYAVRVGNTYGSVTSAAAAVRLSPLVAPFDDATFQNTLPAGLRGLRAIATGVSGNTFVALRADGTVLAWGDNSYGQTNVPPGLDNVVAVAASYDHCMALREDGTVVAWGLYDSGQTNVPAGLSDVVAIAAGSGHSLALKADGTVVAWGANYGGQCNVPPDLSNVVAIAAGSFSLALKADGTVAAWGTYWSGFGWPTMTVPDGLGDVVAIGTGTDHCLAVNRDGRVVAWGAAFHNQTRVPSDLVDAVAVRGGYLNSLALRSDSTVEGWGADRYAPIYAPEVTNVVAITEGGYVGLIGDGPPYLAPRLPNRSGAAGGPMYLNAFPVGKRPLVCQWFLNGTAVPGATNALLAMPSFNPHQAGTYSLRVTNALGSVTVSNINVSFQGLWLGVEPTQDPAQFRLGVYGPAASKVVLQSSTDLVSWTELRRLTNNGTIQVISDNTTGNKQRFYRFLSY